MAGAAGPGTRSRRAHSRRALGVSLLAASLLAAAPAIVAPGPGAGTGADAGDPGLPREDAHVYAPVFDAALVDSAGTPRRLSELWRERPLIVTLIFARCTLICPPFLRSLERAVESVGGAGDDYDVVVVSFDPRDGPEVMAELAARHGLDGEPGWIFAAAAPGEAAALAESIGYWVRWDADSGAADHPAMLAAVDAGRVVRLLVGATVPPPRLREVVWELRHELVPSYPLPSDRVLFRCFRYRPESGGVGLDWGFLLLLAPGAGMFLGTLAIFGRGRPRAGS